MRTLGLEVRRRHVRTKGATCGSASFRWASTPRISEAAESDEVVQRRSKRSSATRRRQKILLGIDRLDYTKGIPRRLLAFERFLEREPQLRGNVRLVQIAVPSRANVEAYADFAARSTSSWGASTARTAR